MSVKGIKKINARYIIIFQQSENETRLWMPHKHTSSTILCVLAGFTFGCENSFGFVGENAMKLKKLIEVRFENSKTAKVEENG